MREKKTRSSESDVRKISISEIGPTQAQKTAAEVSIYLQSVRHLKSAARKRARDEYPFWGRRKFRGELKQQLIDIYVTSLTSPTDQKERSAPTYEEWGTPLASAKILYEEEAPKLGAIEIEAREHASELGLAKRGKIAAKSIFLLNRLPEEQGKQLLKTAGYSNADAKFIHRKLATAGVLDLVTSGVAIAGVTGGAIGEKIAQFVPNVTDGKLLLSYAALYGSAGLLAWTNKKLMDNPAIKTTANVIATAGYYFSPRFVAEKWKKTAELGGVAAGTYLPTLIGEISTWSAISTLVGRQGILGRNLASTFVELLTIVGNLGWIAYKKRQANSLR